jgi:hypothetical protein
LICNIFFAGDYLGMPGIVGAISSIIATAVATPLTYAGEYQVILLFFSSFPL